MHKFLVVLLTLAFSFGSYAANEEVKGIQIAFACDGQTPDLTSYPAFNLYLSNRGLRLQDYTVSFEVVGNELYLNQKTTGTSLKIGELKEAPECHRSYDEPSLYEPNWVDVIVAADISLSLNVWVDTSTCHPTQWADDDGYYADLHHDFKIAHGFTGEEMLLTWGHSQYFANLEQCQDQ